jgi:hypothetical protein
MIKFRLTLERKTTFPTPCLDNFRPIIFHHWFDANLGCEAIVDITKETAEWLR